MRERSAEPIELPDNQDVAVAQRFEAGGKTGSIITATGCTIIIDIAWLDTGGAKSVVLQVEGLRAISFGDAGVADQHGSQTKV
jgi:ribosomal protein L21E